LALNWLRAVKLTILLLVPFLGALYVYQFRDQAREIIRPFEPFRATDLQVSQPNKAEALTALPLNSPVVVVNFWATWCPPCVEEFPSMLELQRVLEEVGVKLVFVSVNEKWSDVEAFMQKYSIQVPEGQLYWDSQKKLAEKWGSTKFPETYVLRPDGWVVEKIIGLQHWTRPAVIEYFRDLALKFKDLKT
jgi:cytochrome c biogenesis protein CcmG, thiol:disulfide interchange protein DsbE